MEESTGKSTESNVFFDTLVDTTFQRREGFYLVMRNESILQKDDASLEFTTQNNVLNDSDSEAQQNSKLIKKSEDEISELISSVVEMMAFRDMKSSDVDRLDNSETYSREEWTREPKLRAYRRDLINYVKKKEQETKGISILVIFHKYLSTHINASFHQAKEFIIDLANGQDVKLEYCQTIFTMIKKVCTLTFKTGKVRPDSDSVMAFTTHRGLAQKAGIKSRMYSAFRGCPVRNYNENLKELFPKAKFVKSEGVEMCRRGDWSTGAEIVYFCKNKCMAFTGSSKDLAECAQCGLPRDPMQRYFYFSPREKVRDLFENKALAKAMKSARKRQNTDGGIDDFFDGKLYKLLSQRCIQNAQLGEDYQEKISLKYFQAPSDLAFLVSFDVVPEMFDKPSYIIVVARCLNLPPAERNKQSNTIKLMAFPAGIDPLAQRKNSAVKDWDSFLYPFIKDSALASTIGYTVHDEDFGTLVTVRHHFVLSVADMSASYDLSGLNGHNSNSPCRYCLDERMTATYDTSKAFPNETRSSSNKLEASSKTIKKHLKPKSKSKTGRVYKKVNGLASYNHSNIRHPKSHTYRNSKPRNVEWYNNIYKHILRDLTKPKTKRSKYTKQGLIRISSIFCLGSMVPDMSFPPNLIHLSYSNIGTTTLNTIIYGKDGPSEFKSTAQESILKFLESLNEIDIKFLQRTFDMTEIAEGVRTSTPAKFTPHQTKTVLSILFGIVMNSQYNHTDPDYLKLVMELIHLLKLLSLPRFSENLFKRLESGIKDFLKFFEDVYLTHPKNLPFMTLPIHTLGHMVAAIRDVGPLRGICCFATKHTFDHLRQQMKSGKSPFLTLSYRYVYESISENLNTSKYVWSKGLNLPESPLGDAVTEEEKNRRAQSISNIYEYLIDKKILESPYNEATDDLNLQATFFNELNFFQRNFEAKRNEYARVKNQDDSSYHIKIEDIIEINLGDGTVGTRQ